MTAIVEFLKDINTPIQVAIISFIGVVLGVLLKPLADRWLLRFKISREYSFKQKAGIKETLSENKTPLIKAAEELNYRLWNLSDNIDKKWHNVPENKWKEERRYYLKSFTYRFLLFLYWLNKAEISMYSFDLSMADSEDSKYLKYLKTMKHFFCESDLLRSLNYDGGHNTHHFYKDDLQLYVKYIEYDSSCIDYKEFVTKFDEDCTPIKKIVSYLVNIENSDDNMNYSVIKPFHLFLILFLNKYGLDYHHTSKTKFKTICNKYKGVKIKKELLDFIERNKVRKESSWIIRYLIK